MSIFLDGFADELTKEAVAGALGRAAGSVVRSPLKSLGIAAAVGFPAYAAYEGYKKGRRGRPRYLAAGPDASGRIRPSRVASVNFHKYLPHAASPKDVKRLSKNYKAERFRS